MHTFSETKAWVVGGLGAQAQGTPLLTASLGPRITHLQDISSVEAQFILTRGHEIKLGDSFHALTRSWKRNNVVIMPVHQGRAAEQMVLPGRLSSGQEGGRADVCRLESEAQAAERALLGQSSCLQQELLQSSRSGSQNHSVNLWTPEVGNTASDSPGCLSPAPLSPVACHCFSGYLCFSLIRTEACYQLELEAQGPRKTAQ